MLADNSTFEKHYRVAELARLWGIGRETARKLFLNEPGVIRIRLGRKHKNTVLSIPASVAARVHNRLLHAA